MIPGVAGARERACIGDALVGHHAFERSEPMAVIGLAGVGIAGGLRALDLLSESGRPFAPGEQAASVEQGRLKFVGLTVSALRNAAEVKVHLEDQGLVYEGISSGPNATRNRLDLVAEATLRALELYLRASGLFLLDGVTLSTIGSHEVVVVVVSLAGREEETLAGSSLVRDDPREAVVRAILDATNRPVSWLLGR